MGMDAFDDQRVCKNSISNGSPRRADGSSPLPLRLPGLSVLLPASFLSAHAFQPHYFAGTGFVVKWFQLFFRCARKKWPAPRHLLQVVDDTEQVPSDAVKVREGIKSSFLTL
jgi:hypothetical protein